MIHAAYHRRSIGAGTVLDALDAEAEDALAARAEFLVAPHFGLGAAP